MWMTNWRSRVRNLSQIVQGREMLVQTYKGSGIEQIKPIALELAESPVSSIASEPSLVGNGLYL